MPFEGSYMWRLRQKVGHVKVIMPGICAIITDGQNRVLLEHRRDFDIWSLPGGSMELGETVLEALAREVQEETGLIVEDAQLMGLNTGPRYDVTYPNGDEVQNFSAVFHVSRWSGTLTYDEAESHGVRWWPMDNLPPLPHDSEERLADFREWQGAVLLK
jgi:ADP-ribose pyrophosphatase YjhB (NUDIX family)